MLAFLMIYFYVGIQRSWLTEKQVYVTASLSKLPYVWAKQVPDTSQTHQVFGSIKAALSPTLQDKG